MAAWAELSQNNMPPPTNKFIVLSVCRFYPRKRLSVLLTAAERLRSRIPGLEIRIVGGGPEEDRLRAISREKNLEDVVVWRRNISGTELAREYSQCHVFCLPSVQEGFGIVFLEAMANAKPIVATRAAAVPEVVRHGLLVEPDNSQNWLTLSSISIASRFCANRSATRDACLFAASMLPWWGECFLRELQDFVALRAEAIRSAG